MIQNTIYPNLEAQVLSLILQRKTHITTVISQNQSQQLSTKLLNN